MPPNPNNNCLLGKRCPKCGSYGPFRVTGSTTFVLHDDGTSGHDDIEFSENSHAVCAGCAHAAPWAKFDDPEVPA